MNRRHFIHTGGVSLGTLLLTPLAGTLCSCSTARQAKSIRHTLVTPKAVRVVTEEGASSLRPSGHSEWCGDAIQVTIRSAGAGLAILLESPKARVKTVTLEWRHEANPSTLCLGDAWERAYGDLAWKKADPTRVMPWYVMENDGAVTHGFGVKTGCASMASWRLGDQSLELVLDVRSGGRGVRLGKRRLLAAEIVARKGVAGETPFQATQAFCRLMCDKPLLPREPMVGMLDWYFTYGKCTDRLFVEESERFARLVEGCGVKAFSLVDAGWAPGDRSAWHEDQTRSHPDFGSIETLPEKVRALGLTPGIWTRVLCTHPRDPEHLRLTRDRIFLDPSLPENLAYIRGLMQRFRSWGFRVIKHDFTTFDIFGRWGFEMGADLTQEGWTFRDDTRTSAEIILGLYRAIREGCGTEAAIIGCNTVSHLCAGLVEYCRIGDDSGNNLERAMKYGCNPFAFRLPQHNAFYVADPDCVGNLKEIPWKYNRQFIQLVAESGALMQISTRLGGITPEQRDTIREGFRRVGDRTPRQLEPLDWMERHIPARWKMGDQVRELDWNLKA